MHAAISTRTITFNDMTYNFATDLNIPLNVKTHYLGQPSKMLERQKDDKFLRKSTRVLNEDESEESEDDVA